MNAISIRARSWSGVPYVGHARRFYELGELTVPEDPEIVGLRNPDDPMRLNWVNRP